MTRLIQPFREKTARKVLPRRCVKVGRQIFNQDTGDRLEFKWNPAENNTLGLWLTRGGWHGHHHFAIEPTNSADDALVSAAKRRRCGVVAASGSTSWRLCLRISWLSFLIRRHVCYYSSEILHNRVIFILPFNFMKSLPFKRLVLTALVCVAPSVFAGTVWLSSLDLKEMTTGWSVAKADLGITGSPLEHSRSKNSPTASGRTRPANSG